MTANWKVLAPYVTLKVKDLNDQTVIMGFLADGVVKNPVEDAAFEKHVRTGMIERISDAPGPEAPPAPLAVEPVFERPAGNASQEAWATYALESGKASEDEIKDLSRDDLRELYG
jgi:hypothetical protein